jgi:hypothetical protein
MEAKDVTKTELKKVAKEFNEQMGLEPPILLDLKVSALKEKCIEAAGQIDLEQDEYSDEVWEVLGALGCDPRVETSDEGVEEDPDETVVEGEEADALVEEAMEDTLVEDFKAAKRLVELKEVAEAWECFEKLDLDSYAGLQGPKKLRADMLGCLPDELREQIEPKPAAKTDKPAKPKKEKKAPALKANKEDVAAVEKAWTADFGKPEDKGIKVAREIEAKTGVHIDIVYRTIMALAKKAA